MLVVIHSYLRYIVLLLTLLVAIQSLMGMTGKGTFKSGNKKSALFMMISCDIQLLVGLAVFFMNDHLGRLKMPGGMADKTTRFFALEHPLSMLIGIVLVHVGYTVVKKNVDDSRKFKKLFWCSLIAFLLFVGQTPWPFKKDVARPAFPAMARA